MSTRNGCTETSAKTNNYTVYVATATAPATPLEITPDQTDRPALSVTLGGDYSYLADTTPTFTFTNVQGLPDNLGLTINPDGTIVGNPLITGTFTFTVDVTDASNGMPIGTKTYSLHVSGALPVVYTKQLSVTGNGSSNILSWETAQEFNNKGFHVLRSTDGRVWNEISFIPSKAINGSGNGAAYSYTDHTPISGINYYQLNQEDKDGKSFLSNIVSITSNSSAITFYPNPVYSNLTITNAIVGSTYRIVDISGKILLSGIINSNTAHINTSNLPSGLYFIELLDKQNNKYGKYKIIKK